MASSLSSTDLARITRTGLRPLSEETGLALFDQALAARLPSLVTARLDLAALEAQQADGTLPPLFQELVRAKPRRADAARPDTARAAAPALRSLLTGAGEETWQATVLEFVRAQIAAVLVYPSPDLVQDDRGLLDMGFDSLTAVELRERLAAAAELRLPATLVFDYPTAADLAAELTARLAADLRAHRSAAAVPAVLADLDRLEAAMDALAAEAASNGGPPADVTGRIDALLAKWRSLTPNGRPGRNGSHGPDHGTTGDADFSSDIDAATDEELFGVLDQELDVSPGGTYDERNAGSDV
jgi:pimaricinolide synthase PimS1